LLAITAFAVIFVAGKLIYRLARHAETKADWVIVAVAAGASIGVVAFMLPHISVDLWMPAFAGGGAAGYARLIFNTGLLAPRQYLPGNLAALHDLNLRANVAFGVGVVGLLGCAAVKIAR